MPVKSRPDANTIAATPPLVWQLRLLGAIELQAPSGATLRLSARTAAALLASLALGPGRTHPREELIERLWPGVDLDAGRNRLRQTLSTLKGTLDAAGLEELIDAGRSCIGLHEARLRCDAVMFEQALRCGDHAAARALYRGELMPGFYDDWVVDERRRLAALHERLEAGTAVRPAPAGEAPRDFLPSYWTRTFGVELTASRLRALLAGHRLVTVHGPGGSGKTRLAVEVAASLRELPDALELPWREHAEAPRFDRIVFVPLVDCVQPAQMLAAIAEALQAGPNGPAPQRIAMALAGRRVLLVLDNLEQLDPAADAEIARLLTHAAGVHVLGTSRRLLGLAGELAFELQGLALPSSAASIDELAGSAAVALLLDRARAARGELVLGPQNRHAVTELVRLLGGMPLALELAASRLRAFSPQELLERLREHRGTPMLDLLARPLQHAPADARHASMRHVLDWSWQQLSAAQARLLGMLSVFGAPAGLGAIAAATGLEAAALPPLIEALQDASLLQALPDGDGSTRCQLMQPVREFAAERLADADARAARQRLRRWLTEQGPAWQRAGPASVARELAHVHAAIVSAPADGEPMQAIALALALRDYWDADALPLPDLLALEAAAAAPHSDATAATALADLHELLSLGRMAAGFAPEAIDHAERALALARGALQRSRALVRWATTVYQSGRLDADFDQALDEALVLARASADAAAQASVLRLQAIVRSNLKLDFAGAETLVEQAQHLWESAGNAPMARMCLLSRAVMWVWQGRIEDGLAVHLACEADAQSSGDWLGLIHVTRQLGRLYIRARRWPQAEAAFRRSLQLAWQRHHAMGVAHALLHLGDALAMSKERPRLALAARLLGFAAQHWQRTFGTLNRIEAHELRRTQRLLRRALGAPQAEALRVQGVSLRLDEAVAMALAEDSEPVSVHSSAAAASGR